MRQTQKRNLKLKEGSMNLNDQAKLIAELEGGKKQVSIAQIKQIMKIQAMIQKLHPKAKKNWDRYVERQKDK